MSVPDGPGVLSGLPSPRGPICLEKGTPPCDALLRDPMSVLGDRGRWPSHICGDVQYALIGNWKRAWCQLTYGTTILHDIPAWDMDRLSLQDFYPELGRRTYREWGKVEIQFGRITVEQLEWRSKVAIREEPATLIAPLLLVTSTVTVVFFGLGHWPEGRNVSLTRGVDSGQHTASLPVPSDLETRTFGDQDDPLVGRFRTLASEWWTSLYGSEFRTRRQRGAPPVPFDDTLALSANSQFLKEFTDARAIPNIHTLRDEYPWMFGTQGRGRLRNSPTKAGFVDWYQDVGWKIDGYPWMGESTLRKKLRELQAAQLWTFRTRK